MTAPRWLLITVVVAVVVAGAVAVPYIEAWTRPTGKIVVLAPDEKPVLGSPMLMPGIDRPDVVAADKAGLADDEPVIGVVSNGKPRAYRVAAFIGVTRHVVNDVVAGRPVTVTYCDKNDCARAFTGDKAGEPLEVALGGLAGDMLLRGPDGNFFWQPTGRLADPERGDVQAFDLMPITRTTWQEWREAHPTTDVYVGQPGR